MKAGNAYDLIQIGIMTRYLMNIKTGYPANVVPETCKKLEDELLAANLIVSHSALKSVNRFQDCIKKIELLGTAEFEDDSLPNELQLQTKTIEDIIFSESRIKNIYTLPERRYNSEYLLSSPGNLLKSGVYAKLSDIGKYDFAASCRCLLFGEATAAAFHILRVTEDTLLQFYFHYKKTNRLSKPMWGPMTTELRNKRSPKPSETVLSALDNVRVSYRNPTQHPQVTYDIDSCQDLFGVCIDIINKMAEKL